MDNNENKYFIPEQLEDSDFEKERKEYKKNRKDKRFELTKKNIIKFISIILVITLIGVGIYLYLNPIQKKATAPEKFVENFCAYFNSSNWEKINSMMDLKGYYILGAILEESEYTKFDKTYKEVKGDDEEYLKFKSTMKALMSVDSEALDDMNNIRIKLNSINACNKIQGTDTFYKLRVNFDYVYNGQSENITDVMYVSNASGEYKMVYGEWMKTILSYYQTIYTLQNSYGY